MDKFIFSLNKCFKISDAIAFDNISEDINASERLFIINLVCLSRLNESLTFQVTNIHLSKRCGCSDRTIRRMKKKFKEQGVYECTSKQDSNKNEATIYTLNPAKMNEILGQEVFEIMIRLRENPLLQMWD